MGDTAVITSRLRSVITQCVIIECVITVCVTIECVITNCLFECVCECVFVMCKVSRIQKKLLKFERNREQMDKDAEVKLCKRTKIAIAKHKRRQIRHKIA